MTNVYMAYKGKNVRLMYNKKEALKLAKKEHGNVYQLSYQYFKDCGFVMDHSTFIQVATKIY